MYKVLLSRQYLRFQDSKTPVKEELLFSQVPSLLVTIRLVKPLWLLRIHLNHCFHSGIVATPYLN